MVSLLFTACVLPGQVLCDYIFLNTAACISCYLKKLISWKIYLVFEAKQGSPPGLGSAAYKQAALAVSCPKHQLSHAKKSRTQPGQPPVALENGPHFKNN